MVKYTHIFWWFYHYLNSILLYMSLTYLDRSIYGTPWWRSLEAETCRRWHETAFWFHKRVNEVDKDDDDDDDDDDVFYIMLISAK